VAVASAGLYASLHLIPDNHTNIPPLSFLQAGCPSCHPTNSVKYIDQCILTNWLHESVISREYYAFIYFSQNFSKVVYSETS